MSKLALGTLLLSLALASAPALTQGQDLAYNQQAGFDSQGNIFVSSDAGKLIWMADTKHCSEASVAADRQTVACRVTQDQLPENSSRPARLEIYSKGGRTVIIEPGPPNLDWHFWNEGKQVSVFTRPIDYPGTYALYDSATGRLVEKLAEPTEESQLPQWAKSPAQIQDESVPMSDALARERRLWISKLLREIGKIKPGMRRQDLLTVFTTEGGLSTRFQRTYVLQECPYIKVNVRFKGVSADLMTEDDAGDIIESISQPYLARSVMD